MDLLFAYLYWHSEVPEVRIIIYKDKYRLTYLRLDTYCRSSYF